MVKNMDMKKNFKREEGSYLIETAIILPITIIFFVTIISIIKIDALYEKVVHSSVDELRKHMINSYISEYNPALPFVLEKRLNSESEMKNKINIENYRDGFTKNNIDNLVSFNVLYQAQHISPIRFNNKVNQKHIFIGRKFLGDTSKKTSFTFERMEKNEENNIVYIFPNDGKRYHKRECTYVKPKADEIVLNNTIRKKYKSCKICKSNRVKNGNIVFVFKGYGKSYHKRECSSVYKNIISIERNVAAKKGYTRCKKCGG